jgi:formylglycine-generating enzyme required for sulfatase activity
MTEAAVRAPRGLPKARIFISYSRTDMKFADRLDAALKAGGFETFVDRSEIYSFEDWWKRIQTLIGKADTVVFVLSPEAISSDVCRKEVAFAASLNKRFAPIVCHPVNVANVPTELSRLNFISFEDDTRFEDSAEKLAQALTTDIEWVRKHTEFGERARSWLNAKRPPGLLLRSPALDEAEQWFIRQPQNAPLPTDAIRAFVIESRKAEILARARARRIRFAFGVLALMLALGGLGWWKQDFFREQYEWRVVMIPSILSTEEEKAKAAKPGSDFKECKTGCPTMIVVPAGAFLMGAPQGEGKIDERPQHQVTIAQPFAIGKYDVTFAEWDACTAAGACPKASDSGWGRDNRPVINVSWNDAKHYVDWLSRLTGKTYRLLTESEWEYAARAGTTTKYWWGDDIKRDDKAMANCLECGSDWHGTQTAPVGTFAANAFGLYDMNGNVTQLVEDCYAINYLNAPADGSPRLTGDCGRRVVRGSSWGNHADDLRSAFRSAYPIAASDYVIGFRVGRTLAP